jgi:hypothetical protein
MEIKLDVLVDIIFFNSEIKKYRDIKSRLIRIQEIQLALAFPAFWYSTCFFSHPCEEMPEQAIVALCCKGLDF